MFLLLLLGIFFSSMHCQVASFAYLGIQRFHSLSSYPVNVVFLNTLSIKFRVHIVMTKHNDRVRNLAKALLKN